LRRCSRACRIALSQYLLCNAREGSMRAIVAIPQLVDELLIQFGHFFPNEPARLHFAEYQTGLFVSEQKTVSGGCVRPSWIIPIRL
jgi:hypothetical protein